VVAAIDEKITPRVGELALLNILDPGAVDADGNVVFGFAGNGAGVAADTFSLVDDKGVFSHGGFPLGDQQALETLLSYFSIAGNMTLFSSVCEKQVFV